MDGQKCTAHIWQNASLQNVRSRLLHQCRTGIWLLPSNLTHTVQEKQKQRHFWSPSHHRPNSPGQAVHDDAALLAKFCTTRSDTAHLAQCFASLAKRAPVLSAVADYDYHVQSQENVTTSQSMQIGESGQGDAESHDMDQGGEHMPAHDSWQHQLIEATDELGERFQALLSLPPAQVNTSFGMEQ